MDANKKYQSRLPWMAGKFYFWHLCHPSKPI